MDATRRASIQAIGAASLAALAGNIAYAQTARKLTILIGFPADGSTVMLVPAGNMTIYPHIYNKLKCDWQKDFALLATACEFQFGMAVGPAVPARTLKEFVDWARANPAKDSFGTPGAGTGMHFLGVMFGRDARIDFNHIPYKGGAPALTDAMGGNIPAVFTTLPNLVQPHKDGRIRILGFSGDSRLKGLPDVPTFKESGPAGHQRPAPGGLLRVRRTGRAHPPPRPARKTGDALLRLHHSQRGVHASAGVDAHRPAAADPRLP